MADQHVNYLNSTVRDELIKASVAMYKAQPANKHKFLAEYFAKISAEREQGQEEKKEAKKGGKKKKVKKVKMALSDVQFEITPDTSVEYDWDKVQAEIADILIEGVLWAPKFSLQPFVFGLQKLNLICQIMDAKVPTTTVIVDALKTIHGVGGAEMLTIESAAADWESLGQGRKGTTRPPQPEGKGKKKGGKQQQQQKQGGGKKKKKKKGKKNDGPRVVTPEMIQKDAATIIASSKESDYYVSAVPQMDGSAQTDVTIAQLKECLAQVRVKAPDKGYMLVASGSTQITILASLPGDKSKDDALAWVNSTGLKGEGSASEASTEYKCDGDAGEFPIKMKDQLTSAAFAYLKKAGVLDDGSEDEFYSIADDDDEGY